MTVFESIVLAVVEGLTEFLPVSSTGHMVLTQGLLGMKSDEFVKAFTVIIQFGAILSVIVLYWKRFFQSFAFYWKLLVAFLPAAVLGLIFSDFIDSMLENIWVVSLMLLIGGILMLFVDKWFASEGSDSDCKEVSYPSAFRIGLFQCIAMIPGVSRSMATIVGGMTQGLNRKTAAEFSFFLAVPTMFAATLYKLYKLIGSEHGFSLLKENWDVLVLGNLFAFIVAMAAIRGFVGFITRYGFKLFGWYRIIVSVVLLLAMMAGVDMSL